MKTSSFFSIFTLSLFLPMIIGRLFFVDSITDNFFIFWLICPFLMASLTGVLEKIFDDSINYDNCRINTSNEEALPPRPRGYQFYKIISTAFSILSIFFGAILFGVGIILIFKPEIIGGIGCLIFGFLAIYYGIKDTKELVRSTKNRIYIAIGAVVALIATIACAPSDDDIRYQYLEQIKSSLPIEIAEGFTVVDAGIEDNNIIYIISIDEDIYDIDEFITLMAENEESYKQDILNDPNFKKNLGLFKRTNTNLIYRHIGNSSQKYIDITITPDEM